VHDDPVFFVSFAQHMPPDWRHHKVGELQASDIVPFGPEIEAEDSMLYVFCLNVPSPSNLEVQPSEIEFPIQRRITPFGDDHAPSTDLADVEAEPFNQHVEAEHVWIERRDTIPAQPGGIGTCISLSIHALMPSGEGPEIAFLTAVT
jgi:hypothetical protein